MDKVPGGDHKIAVDKCKEVHVVIDWLDTNQNAESEYEHKQELESMCTPIITKLDVFPSSEPSNSRHAIICLSDTARYSSLLLCPFTV